MDDTPGAEPLLEPLSFKRGPSMRNRMMLAPLTNLQSHADGAVSEAETRWLAMRARGGFGLVMTAAAHVQADGQGYDGQLGVFGDQHLPGLTRLADQIRAHEAVSSVQLYHAGSRALRHRVSELVSASDDPETGARALSLDEIQRLRDDFVAAARRAERAGFDGVEIHGAHNYILMQFHSPEMNRREDRYGGDLANRNRLLFEIIDGIRASCGPQFQFGLRLSAERFGLRLDEVRETAAQAMRGGQLDYLDLSLWDAMKLPSDPAFRDRSLLAHFTDLERNGTRLGVAGKIMSAADARAALAAGVDFVLLGRAAILHHDYPIRVAQDRDFIPAATPVSPGHLETEGLSAPFIGYMRGFKGFVQDPEPAAAPGEAAQTTAAT